MPAEPDNLNWFYDTALVPTARLRGLTITDWIFNPIRPETVTGLTAVCDIRGGLHIDVSWSPSVAKGTVAYELQRFLGWQILSLEGEQVWTDDVTMREYLMVRYGSMTLSRSGDLDLPAGSFVSFSGADYEGVTFEDIEISAFYVSGSPELVIRSDNGGGPNGWHAYVARVNPTTITVHVSDMGVLSDHIAIYPHVTTPGERIAFRAVGHQLTVLIDGVDVINVVDMDFYNGVVGFAGGDGGGVWNIGIADFGRIMLADEQAYTDEGILLDYQYAYRARAVNSWGQPGLWGDPVWVRAEHQQIATAFTETITIACELNIDVIPIIQTYGYAAETITAAFTELIIDVIDIEILPMAFTETVMAALTDLSIVVQASPTASVPLAETITAALTDLSIGVYAIELIETEWTDTVTCALQDLTITVSAA